MGNAHIITEHKDDTLENYFFGLIMAKAVTYETIDGVLAKIRYLPTELGDRTSEMRWLSEEERMAIIWMLLGSGFDGDFDGIRKYVNRTFLEHMDIIRKMPYEERGAIPSLILNIVENLIDIHDSNAMNFVMHDKKEDVERLLLECVVNATKELGRELLSILSSVRDLFERTVGANHAAELATISGRVKRAMESLVEKYEYDPEIENNIELFRIDMQRLRSRL